LFTHVLVPLDGSPLAESALPHAAALARSGVQVTLLQVLEPEAGAAPADPLDWRLRRDAALFYLQRVTDEFVGSVPARVSAVVAEGRAADQILAVARREGADIIVMSSHGAGGLSPWDLNSVAFKVAQRAGVSLLLVRGYQRAPWLEEREWRAVEYQRILVPLDGSVRGEHVIPAVNRLAGPEAHLDLAHVVPIPSAIERFGPSPPREGERDGNRRVEQAHRYLDAIGRECAGSVASTTHHVLRDRDTCTALEALIEQRQVDLVVISAHGHSARRQQTHGSLTSHFVLHGATSLLIVQDLPWAELQPSAAERAVGVVEQPVFRTPGRRQPRKPAATQPPP
jgi:nucleotide-binding universal stress UspA family protein